jgi:hypothetical protein
VEGGLQNKKKMVRSWKNKQTNKQTKTQQIRITLKNIGNNSLNGDVGWLLDKTVKVNEELGKLSIVGKEREQAEASELVGRELEQKNMDGWMSGER